IWAELQSASHPGSRIYFGSYADPDLRLWTIGISGLLEVLADALEDGGVISWTGNEHRLDGAALQSALTRRRPAMDWPDTQWTIPIGDDSQWPSHWKAGASN
ncbi:MAG: hypothetical protein KJN63_04045, partial [Acidimicrobiia bacterium]|nr:hypothetical protein [Acidimicrobiia bacterium]